MKKVLFIDRDGTLVVEPPIDYQLDSLEKLEYYPGVFSNLSKIVKELDYEIVMVTNQDGLGTDSFPEDTFWPAHNKIIQAFKNEGIMFADVHIDRTFPEQNAPTRKPGTAMLTRYLNGDYDLENSFVIGDRWSDIELANNLGAQGIFIGEEKDAKDESASLISKSWGDIYQFLRGLNRKSKVIRNTNETKISIELNLDDTSNSSIDTDIPFFNHMLDQVVRHGSIGLNVQVKGDVEIDEHHTIEDTALALGSAFREALGKKTGIERYAFVLPMDDCEASVSIDFGGRPWLVWDVEFSQAQIGSIDANMFHHFFKSFSDEAKCNLNIKCTGDNDHHKIESIFKAFARAVKQAVKKDANNNSIPSTKGVL